MEDQIPLPSPDSAPPEPIPADIPADPTPDLAARVAALEAILSSSGGVPQDLQQQASAMAQPRLQQEYGDMASIALKVFLYDNGPQLAMREGALFIGDMTFEAGVEEWLKSPDAIRLKPPVAARGLGSNPEMLAPTPQTGVKSDLLAALAGF